MFEYIYIVFILLIIITSIISPKISLLLFISITPFEDALLIRENLTILKVAGIFILLGFILNKIVLLKRGVSNSTIYYSKEWLFLFILFAIYGAASILWSVEKNIAIQKYLTLLQLLGLSLLIYNIINDKRDISLALRIYSIFSFVASLMIIYNYFTNVEYDINYRAVIIDKNMSINSQNAAHPGFILALGMFYYLIKWYRAKTKRSIIYIISFSILLFASLLSKTRTFLVSFSIAFIVLLIYFSRNKIKSRNHNIIAIIIIFILITIIMPSDVITRFRGSFGVHNDWSGRKDIWKVATVMILDNPLKGVGLSNSWYLYYEYVNKLSAYGMSINDPMNVQNDRDMHNIYLELCTELGILSMIFFISVLFRIIKKLIINIRILEKSNADDEDLFIIGSALICVIIGGLAEPILLRKYFWIFLSFGMVVGKIKK